MSEEDKKPFAVKDRRHFTAEGDARPDAPEVPAADAEADPPAAAPPVAELSGEPLDEPLDEPAHLGEPDLVGLLLSLAAQASALLGMGGDEGGEGEAPRVDLAGARGLIGLLEVLERKTKGNRTPEEDQVLTGVLYELRMAYLARAR
jgi:uncharacterized protein DUF1844